MKKKLTKFQQKAIDFFKDNGFMVAAMPKRSGKTTLLQEIIKRNPQSRIGIRCPSYETYIRCYKQFKNCHYIGTQRADVDEDEKYDITLGDERPVNPPLNTKAVYAFTKEFWTSK